MKIVKVHLDYYDGPDDDYITIGKEYYTSVKTEEEDGEYTIIDDGDAQHVILPEWCTVVEDEFGVRDIKDQKKDHYELANNINGITVKEDNNYFQDLVKTASETNLEITFTQNKVVVFHQESMGSYYEVSDEDELEEVIKAFKMLNKYEVN